MFNVCLLISDCLVQKRKHATFDERPNLHWGIQGGANQAGDQLRSLVQTQQTSTSLHFPTHQPICTKIPQKLHKVQIQFSRTVSPPWRLTSWVRATSVPINAGKTPHSWRRRDTPSTWLKLSKLSKWPSKSNLAQTCEDKFLSCPDLFPFFTLLAVCRVQWPFLQRSCLFGLNFDEPIIQN